MFLILSQQLLNQRHLVRLLLPSRFTFHRPFHTDSVLDQYHMLIRLLIKVLAVLSKGGFNLVRESEDPVQQYQQLI